ncbi:MAG: hypothetical protein AMJ94_16460 [Deltaproteobacteria bacterium SM23_61]|nr:MAG: hypothetical protein AMJ94_16460 [Deltaproteobacteria bacterium SM23_61]
MGRFLPRILDTKRDAILARERSLAKTVAASVVESKPVTAWEILIPILFLTNLFQLKRSRETFSLNFLFTKRMALEAAFARVDKGKSREEVRKQIKDKTGNVLASDKAGLYSSKIRQKQLREMDLLIDHYSRLLEAEGKDYLSLVRNAYRTRENYLAFLGELEEAEKEVYLAATQTVKTSSAREIASKMEEATNVIRRAELDRLFP